MHLCLFLGVEINPSGCDSSNDWLKKKERKTEV